MSPTTDDLREQLSSELATFGALPSVAGRALIEGRRTRRRRGVAACVLAVLAASVGVGVTASNDPNTSAALDPGTDPTTTPSTTTPSREFERPRSDDWNAHVAQTLSALLPTRYGEVRIHRDYGRGGVALFRTVSGVQGVEFHFQFYPDSLYGYDLGTCDDELWWMSSCEVTDPPGAWQGRVFHQKVGTDEEGSGPVHGKPAAWHYGGGAELSWPGLDVTWGAVPIDDQTPLGLTDDELRAVVEDPAFGLLLEEGSAIFAR